MTTGRLFTCLIALFNHVAPPEVHLAKHGLQYIPKNWSFRYKRAAVIASCLELRKRDLNLFQRIYLTHMRNVVAKLWSPYAPLLK